MMLKYLLGLVMILNFPANTYSQQKEFEPIPHVV